MLVTAVGPNSQQGRIFTLMRGIEEESGQSGFNKLQITSYTMVCITLKFGACEFKHLCFITESAKYFFRLAFYDNIAH